MAKILYSGIVMTVVLAGLVICTVQSGKTSVVEPVLCCVDEEFEARMYLDSGTVFIDTNTAFAYQNGTVHFAYSLPRGKIYMHTVGLELSPLMPRPAPVNMTTLIDYTTNMQYTVTSDGCQKDSIDTNMTRLCIPANAEFVSSGTFGTGSLGRQVSTYRYNQGSDVPMQVTATVYKHDLKPITPEPCDPVHVTYFLKSGNPDSGSLFSMSVMDMGPVKSGDIFDIPDACKH